MADVGIGIKRVIQDVDGEAATVTNNRLDVNATIQAGDLNVGNVDIHLNGGVPILGNAGAVAAGVLRVTLASDDPAVALLGTIDADTGTCATALSNSYTLTGNSWQSVEGESTGLIMSGVLRNDTLANPSDTYISDGDMSILQTDSVGGLYVTGSEIENAAVQSEPLLIGGRYDSSARTLGNGDAGAVALNASGHILVDVVDGGQLDTIIDTLETTLTAIETDQAAIETLLTGMDSDTDAIKTAVQILDNAISGNEMQVDVVAALPAGSNAIGKLAANSGVDIGDVDVTSIIPGTSATSLGKAEDAGHSTGDVGVFPLGVRMDTPGSTTSSVGNYGGITLDAYGAQWCVLKAYNSNNPIGHTPDDSYSNGNDGGVMTLAVRNDELASLVGSDGDYTPFQVDAKGALYTTHGITGIQSDNNEGVDDSTAEVLKSSTACKRVDMQADPSNTGYIYVGGSDVSATKGIRLAPGDFYSIDVNNTADIYVLASVDEEDIHFTYFT